MGYKLADGSDSDLYRVGDTFLSGKRSGTLIEIGEEPLIDFGFSGEAAIFSEQLVDWRCLKPTEETKRKARVRKLYRSVGDKVFTSTGFIGMPVKVPPCLIDSLRALKDGIINNNEAKALVQDAINALSVEPLARIIDWRGGEEVKQLDFVISNEFGVDYRAVVLEVVSPTQIRTCRGLIGASHGNLTIIRINTSAIPKQRTMTKAEVEREFGVKISD